MKFERELGNAYWNSGMFVGHNHPSDVVVEAFAKNPADSRSAIKLWI